MSVVDGHEHLRADTVLEQIADYALDYRISNAESFRMARYCIMDALGCALDALRYPECLKLLGPVIRGTVVPGGARVPGTQFVLDPVCAAFNIGSMIRWTDFNDSFHAAEPGHPSDNLGGILATADCVSQARVSEGKPPLLMRDVLTALIKAYEIQGVLSLENNFAESGFDHAGMTKVASAAVTTAMMGGHREQIISAVSNAFADGLTLRIYRQGTNTGSRKSWAGGNATSRAVALGLMAMRGEMGYPAVLSAKKWGFYDVIRGGRPFEFQRMFGSYVLRNSTFKFVASGSHSQTAVEAALRLHEIVKHRIAEIAAIEVTSHKSLIGIMDKTTPLRNAADRDHCVRYVVAVALIHGRLTSADFDDAFAADPRIEDLRLKTTVIENEAYTRSYYDPAKRSNANAIQIRFADGTTTPRIEIEYPLGHPKRRKDGIPMLEEKFRMNLAGRFPADRETEITSCFANQARFERLPVHQLIDRFVI